MSATAWLSVALVVYMIAVVVLTLFLVNERNHWTVYRRDRALEMVGYLWFFSVFLIIMFVAAILDTMAPAAGLS